MRNLIKPFFAAIPIVVFLACGRGISPGNAHSVSSDPPKHHNRIDDINNKYDVETLLKTFGRQFNHVKVSDSLVYSDKECQKFSDSLHTKPWIKADFDGNGYTDMLISYSTGNNHIICIMDSSNNAFRTRDVIISWDQECVFPEVLQLRESPAIILRERVEPDWSKPKKPGLLRADTLFFKFGGFVEYNRRPSGHNIQQIKYTTTRCYGKCPAFELTINQDRSAVFNALYDNKISGIFNGTIDQVRYRDLVDLLNYLNFSKLKNSYSVNWTDMQSCTLKITYDNGKVKTIYDYGLIGTHGLNRAYVQLFDLTKSQEWKK
jgi:hypothetical protein